MVRALIGAGTRRARAALGVVALDRRAVVPLQAQVAAAAFSTEKAMPPAGARYRALPAG